MILTTKELEKSIRTFLDQGMIVARGILHGIHFVRVTNLPEDDYAVFYAEEKTSGIWLSN